MSYSIKRSKNIPCWILTIVQGNSGIQDLISDVSHETYFLQRLEKRG